MSGVDLICRELSIPEGRIALKKTYTKEIEALTAAIEKLHSKVQLHLMDSFYPAGDEQVVVYEVRWFLLQEFRWMWVLLLITWQLLLP